MTIDKLDTLYVKIGKSVRVEEKYHHLSDEEKLSKDIIDADKFIMTIRKLADKLSAEKVRYETIVLYGNEPTLLPALLLAEACTALLENCDKFVIQSNLFMLSLRGYGEKFLEGIVGLERVVFHTSLTKYEVERKSLLNERIIGLKILTSLKIPTTIEIGAEPGMMRYQKTRRWLVKYIIPHADIVNIIVKPEDEENTVFFNNINVEDILYDQLTITTYGDHPIFPNAYDEEVICSRFLLDSSLEEILHKDSPDYSTIPSCPDTDTAYNPDNMQEIRTYLSKYVTQYGADDYSSGVYSFPVFTEAYCKELLNFSEECEYNVNLEETTSAQIPEVIVENYNSELASKLEDAFMEIVSPISSLVYFTEPCKLKVVQFAKYTPNTVQKGVFHKDIDSDITLVVNLSSGFEGGGTLIKPAGLGDIIEVPPLPVGHALLFNGRYMSHMGIPVTKGSRDLLVFWSSVE